MKIYPSDRSGGGKKGFFKKKLLLIPLLTLIIMLVSLTLAFLFAENVCLIAQQNPKMTSFMKIRQEEARKHNRPFRLQHSWLPLKHIPHILVQGVICSEDDRFFDHAGFDWKEIRQALKSQKRSGAYPRGASTISQQLIKNLYLTPQRSLIRKARELILTLKLEHCVSKKRILECYLNLIEFGDGIFGVEAASWHFFSKPVSALSLFEILRLISVIPKPLRVTPLSNSQYTKWRIRWIAERLMRKGEIPLEQYRQIAAKLK